MASLERIWPAIVLVIVGPITAEFLLGGYSIRQVSALGYFGLIYGFGALLIREIARQTGRGWPTIVALGFVYGVIEEGIALQTLFNPNFRNMHLLEYGYIPALGMASVYTLTVLSLHIIWSICVPIALVEFMFAPCRTKPWLGRIGLGVAALGYAAGIVIFLAYNLPLFSATPFQYGIAAFMLLVGLAVTWYVSIPRKAAPLPGAAPNPWILGVLAFAGTSIMWILQYFADKTFHLPAAVTSTIQVVLAIAALMYIFTSARREGWSNVHRFALLTGALCTYFWHGLYWVWSKTPFELVGQFGLIALYVALLILAWRRLRAAPDVWDSRDQTGSVCGSVTSRRDQDPRVPDLIQENR
jgi:hypothetical protein